MGSESVQGTVSQHTGAEKLGGTLTQPRGHRSRRPLCPGPSGKGQRQGTKQAGAKQAGAGPWQRLSGEMAGDRGEPSWHLHPCLPVGPCSPRGSWE